MLIIKSAFKNIVMIIYKTLTIHKYNNISVSEQFKDR